MKILIHLHRVARVLKSMDADLLRLYPDPTNGCLVKALADYYGLSEEQVFVGIGSDDVLSMSFLTFLILENLFCFQM